MNINFDIKPTDLSSRIDDFWQLSGRKILSIEKGFELNKSTPVITRNGKYVPQGWTEWTQGFQYGSAILQFEASGDEAFLDIGRKNTFTKMASHLTHFGVHDHGFNNISTYGNLLRLMVKGKIDSNDEEKAFYQLALKTSGAVQAHRWSKTSDGGGYIYSFNGPHSLFIDTVRSCRILMLSHLLGHRLMGEQDVSIDLMQRTVEHLLTTAKYNIYYGEGRDSYDIKGRTAHECIFNTSSGSFRCPGTQQGYSGFSTWTRGLAWAMCGFAEELELFEKLPPDSYESIISKDDLIAKMLKAARATCDFYIQNTPTDGIPYWDTGAPGLASMGDYLDRPSEPFNDFEPVDSSAAAIAAQALLRLGHYLNDRDGSKYTQAGLTIANTLLSDPYLSTDEGHQGLILHAIYHRPNGWDTIPEGKKIPCNESAMWGDYHMRELAIQMSRMIHGQPYYAFFDCIEDLP